MPEASLETKLGRLTGSYVHTFSKGRLERRGDDLFRNLLIKDVAFFYRPDLTALMAIGIGKCCDFIHDLQNLRSPEVSGKL